MRISILLPTFNRARYLREALASARVQTAPIHEILVSDDGSTDDTRAYLAAVAAEDPRVKLLTDNPTPGIFTNMNFLVGRCTGDAFCILGDDDRLDPTYVEQLAAPLREQPEVVAAFCDHRIIDAAGELQDVASENNSRKWGRDTLPAGLAADPIEVALRQTLCIGFSLFRTAAVGSSPFDLACHGAADIDFTLRLAKLGRFFYVSERLADYRHHPGTATVNKAQQMCEGAARALGKHRFTGAHERLRLTLVRKALLSCALLAAPTDRWAAFSALAGFVKSGGWPFAPRAVAALALTLSPRAIADRAKTLLRAASRGLDVA